MGKARKFDLHIVLGNDAMQTHNQVADALEETAKKIRGKQHEGKIMDANGNSVGRFKFT